MLTTIYVRSLDGINYRTSPDGVRWADQPRCQGEYLVSEEIKHFGLIGQGFWSLTGEVPSTHAAARKAYPVARHLRNRGFGFILTNLVGPAKPGKSDELRAIERAAIIRYLEIWQDTVRGKISRARAVPWSWWGATKLVQLRAEQLSVQRRLRIVRAKGLCH